jgi:CTP:molybdopterin cytidylyltransferase MocA
MTGVAGILLAAGEGSRLGRPKALVELGGRTLAERGVAMLREGGADPVLVVTGAALISMATARIVYNPGWRSGMGSSLAVGLAALATKPRPSVPRPSVPRPSVPRPSVPRPDAVVIALADQPLIGAEAVRRLIAAYQTGATVAVATYDGQPRNPVLIAREHWPAVIESARGDVGARPFLRAHPDLVTGVECGDTGAPDDIDTPEDLRRAKRVISEGQ